LIDSSWLLINPSAGRAARRFWFAFRCCDFCQSDGNHLRNSCGGFEQSDRDEQKLQEKVAMKAKVLLTFLFLLLPVSEASACPCTIWPNTTTPALVDAGADAPVELGVTFKADSNGYITGIRFYKSARNTGTHTAHLWSGAGALLASATFSGESSSGWQQVNFAKPVAITANTVYVASYHTMVGHESVGRYFFATSGVSRAPLHALANVSGSPDGPYTYGSTSTFPRSTYRSSNYWVDVVFAGTAASPLQITMPQLPGAMVAGTYSVPLKASGGTVPYTWRLISGGLPSGLALSTSGTISGTAKTAGTFSFSVQVKDVAGHSATGNFRINVGAPAPGVVIVSPSSGATVSGTVYAQGTASDSVSLTSVHVSVDGGSYVSASGTSRWTFSIDTNSLSNGLHTISARVSDAAGITATSAPVGISVKNGALATDCTLYASPSGNDGNSGTTPTAAKSLTGAAAATRPGSVVCLHGGNYNLSSSFSPPSSGTPSSWITYRDYGDGSVNIVWTGAADASPIFRLGTGSFPSGPAYLEFRGLNLNGHGNAGDAFFCHGAHHLRFIGNTMSDTGGSGIGTRDCDYLTADHNVINHNGYVPSSTSVPQWYGWTSGISFNSNQWFDNYGGFHNIISNNIVVGEYDSSSNHTDGNGIILDLSNGSYTASTANTPPALIINNVVYGNGGRCVHAFIVTNFWVVNNTCYKNNLDSTLGNAGSFSTNNSHDGYFVNNISVAWDDNNAAYVQEGTNSNIHYYADLYFGSSVNFASSFPSEFIQANPLFANAPSLAGGQYATALAPSLLGDGLHLLPVSPARDRGIDPSTLPNVPAAIVTDLQKYIYADINGKTRVRGSFDLGAYQFQ
jgi:hypothetical protein